MSDKTQPPLSPHSARIAGGLAPLASALVPSGVFAVKIIAGIVGMTTAFLVISPIWNRLPTSPRVRVGITWYALIIHLVACVGLLIVQNGTELNSDFAARYEWIKSHQAIWIGNWLIWMLASSSLLMFVRSWIHYEFSGNRTAGIAGVVVAVGVVFDFMGETTLMCCAFETVPAETFAEAYRLYQWFSPAIANGLYCVGGIALSLMSLKQSRLSKRVVLTGIAVWAVGFVLTLAAIVNSTTVMTVSGGGVMVLFCIWLVLFQLEWSEGRDS